MSFLVPVFTAAFLGLFQASEPPQSVQTVPQEAVPQEATTVEDVVVEGRTTRLAVQSFVGLVARPAGQRGPARFGREFCVGVANVRGALAQPLADRVSAVGAELGLRPGLPGCRPNLIIMMTDNGADLARQLVRSRNRQFLTSVSGASAGRAALEDFQNSDRAVRWWHVSLPVDPGTGLTTSRVRSQDVFQGAYNDGRTPADFGNAVSRVLPSRLTSDVKDELQQVLVIVDVNRVGDIGPEQLADYVAMVGLAQIDPQASTAAYDSILNLFADGGAAGLTKFDLAYLHGLYDAPQIASTGSGRVEEVVVAMERQLKATP